MKCIQVNCYTKRIHIVPLPPLWLCTSPTSSPTTLSAHTLCWLPSKLGVRWDSSVVLTHPLSWHCFRVLPRGLETLEGSLCLSSSPLLGHSLKNLWVRLNISLLPVNIFAVFGFYSYLFHLVLVHESVSFPPPSSTWIPFKGISFIVWQKLIFSFSTFSGTILVGRAATTCYLSIFRYQHVTEPELSQIRGECHHQVGSIWVPTGGSEAWGKGQRPKAITRTPCAPDLVEYKVPWTSSVQGLSTEDSNLQTSSPHHTNPFPIGCRKRSAWFMWLPLSEPTQQPLLALNHALMDPKKWLQVCLCSIDSQAWSRVWLLW